MYKLNLLFDQWKDKLFMDYLVIILDPKLGLTVYGEMIRMRFLMFELLTLTIHHSIM